MCDYMPHYSVIKLCCEFLLPNDSFDCEQYITYLLNNNHIYIPIICLDDGDNTRHWEGSQLGSIKYFLERNVFKVWT